MTPLAISLSPSLTVVHCFIYLWKVRDSHATSIGSISLTSNAVHSLNKVAQKREADQVSIKDPLQEQKDRDLFRYVQSGRSGVPDVGFEGYHSEPGGLDV